MQQVELSVYEVPVPLIRPYNLSFATISSFHTFIVKAEVDGKCGFGEITPLPGYSSETPESVKSALGALDASLSKGESIKDFLGRAIHSDPFFTSGILCAIDTLDEWKHCLDEKATPVEIPVCALCDAADAPSLARNARALIEKGFKSLKLKVGKRPVDEDISRVKAVSESLTDNEEIRLDANQAYTLEQAQAICNGLEGVAGVSYLEQPLGPDQWEETRQLVRSSPIPIMLDEAIWTTEHVRKAAEVGAKWVKMKLCKHAGFKGAIELIELARTLGLSVIWGNGVQSPLGNHYEACIHDWCKLTTACEGNGFSKVASCPYEHGLKLSNGKLVDYGVNVESLANMDGNIILHCCFKL